MKRLLILLLGITLSITTKEDVCAQQRYKFQDSLGTYSVRFTPHDVNDDEGIERNRVRTDLTGWHELRLGMAYNPYTPHGYAPNIEWRDHPYDRPTNSILGNLHWYTINGDYGYWFRRWLYVGGVASWTAGISRVWSVVDRSRMDAYNYNAITIMPIVRFAWLNHGIVQLYSGVGIGATAAIYERKLSVPADVRLKMNFDVTFFGISVGKRWFGYFDIGAGARGTISAGAGYRFTTKE